MAKQYRSLKSEEIVKTITRLHERVGERFPNSGLVNVTKEVRDVASEAKDLLNKINSPHKIYRTLSIVLIMGIVALFLWILSQLGEVKKLPSTLEFLEFLEAGISSMVFIGAGIFFLWSLETRYKRHLIVKAIHELRSLAHVVDMHQLTKDPETLFMRKNKTKSSPERKLTPYQIHRYLDYCSELLSIISKVGSLYVDEFADQASLNAVDSLETLTNGLSRKIWQKLNILTQGFMQQNQLLSQKAPDANGDSTQEEKTT
ncbi:hypothetical protein [Candidatus Uabimicrobium amorphum]|uniref:Membrane protein n=1 Tax=Uabimicrobium amorphum TaxID=2596890 RepID=A0A5S9F737_UABAM|nr:hypothetical protein [Candidatus Uabimicrobium amorphum]BBM88262.1 membrane protein [Candidatus Uabimicrobium amorphum]